MVKIETSRLFLEPMTLPELDACIVRTEASDPELSQAYREMRSGCLAKPEQYLWYAPWKFVLRDGGAQIGDVCFKGLPENGQPEIGYGLEPEYWGRGYATEGVRALCRWALAQSGIRAVEAETLADNAASIRVLEKLGFSRTGETGEEGPRFLLKPEDFRG